MNKLKVAAGIAMPAYGVYQAGSYMAGTAKDTGAAMISQSIKELGFNASFKETAKDTGRQIVHDILTPTMNTYHGVYAGSLGLRGYMAGEYNFNLMLMAPKWEDLVYLDIQMLHYGIAVNENTIPRPNDPDVKNGSFNYIQCRNVAIKSNVENAKQQLTAMLKRGTRFWKPDKTIGAYHIDQTTSIGSML